ncbi:vWA domain-containing protein [Chitinophaga solisilvae]|uniref:VWA domain-containing protein n=1 Tax=Chitinophaga solisilvae TaxID=1233460 RepID=A0A3S1BMZ2_9BACT|nr:VWA domain-containing protein [Chitinophaga solisilvae]NSL86362.1 VWA domain-containing protein [Chitinophaga solisilvae]
MKKTIHLFRCMMASIVWLLLLSTTARADFPVNKPDGFVTEGEYITLYLVKGQGDKIVDFDPGAGAPAGAQSWYITAKGCPTAPARPCTFPVFTDDTQGLMTINTNTAYTATFSVGVTIGAESAIEQKVKIVVRNTIDIALVLDRSGSMSGNVNGSWPSVVDSSRWKGLITGVGLLAAKLKEFCTDKDSIGYRYFENTVFKPNAPFNGGLVSLPVNALAIQTEVASHNPGSSTALGDGMAAAAEMLKNKDDHSKIMFVFSDGEQNDGDLVRSDSPQVTVGKKNLNDSGRITTYTIGLGNAEGYLNMLEAIAEHQTDRFLTLKTIGANDITKMVEAFDAMVNRIKKESSPQFVDVRRNKYTRDGYVWKFKEKFTVNKGISKVFITLVSSPSYEDGIESLKIDSLDVLPYARQFSGIGFRTLVVDFPISERADIKPEGVWTVVGQQGGYNSATHSSFDGGTAKAPAYYLSFTVDDHLVHLDYSLGDKAKHVGDVVRPSVRLTRAGVDVKNAVVKAVQLAPGVDIGNFLATAGGEYNNPDTTDPGSPSAQKLAELLRDTAIAAKLADKVSEITLTYDGTSGTYTGSFPKLQVSGNYQVLFYVQADDSIVSKIMRYESGNYNVAQKDVDLSQSGVSVVVNGAGQTVITIRPRAGNGLYWGPGWAGSIHVNFPGAKVNNVVDKGDGTYVITIDGKLEGKGTISIGDVKILDGDASQLNCYSNHTNFWEKIKCWLIAHGLPVWLVWVIIAALIILLWLIFKKKK